MNAAEALEAKDNGTILPDLKLAAMLRCRVRYFTDGAVIGSKAFVNETFAAARERFTERRHSHQLNAQSVHNKLIATKQFGFWLDLSVVPPKSEC
jgi:hypothetical protein